MSSRRTLKKDLNYMFFEIVDECLWVQELDATKTAASEALIDEAVEFQNSILADINKAKTKKDFAPIKAKFKASQVDFVNKLNSLN